MSPKKKIAKKAATTKKTPAKKAPAKKAVKKAAKKETPETNVLESRTRKETPSIFKIKAKKNTPIVFTLEDVENVLKSKKDAPKEDKKQSTAAKKKVVKKAPVKKMPKQKKQVYGAASLSDILGFNPAEKGAKPASQIDESKLPKKHLKYYHLLLDLRKHVKEGLDMHTQDTLMRSSKEDSGDLSSYSQHMADAGTDTFDRDFALSLVSSEQDALFEIEEAIQRIIDGSYGVCEITGVPIAKDRLEAVPFTRYSLEGQQQLESQQKSQKERGGVFAETSLEDTAKYTDDDGDS